MNVLVIGSGGREHALADAFSRSSKVDQVFVSPGNDGIANEFTCVYLPEQKAISEFCEDHSPIMVFIGSETPIAEGLSDYLRELGIPVVAPSMNAAKLETSKTFAKKLMKENGIPTAKYVVVNYINEVAAALAEFSYPLVIKADGLAAGKGVVIAQTEAEAYSTCISFLGQSSGSTGLVIEEYLKGWEVTLFVITDGRNYQTTLFSQDHKQLYDNDKGLNTGGMGAICPVPEAELYRSEIELKIIEPTLSAMKRSDSAYIGFLYLGLMITPEGPKVIEYNCRLGDPETQAMLPLLKTDFMDVCAAILQSNVSRLQLAWADETSISIVMASPGYPGDILVGLPIVVPPMHAKVYYAGVKKVNGELLNSGGRVLCVVSQAEDKKKARIKAYNDLKHISFDQKVFRTDIGLRDNKL